MGGLIALGYQWFGVLGWTGTAGQVGFGLLGGGMIVLAIVVFSRMAGLQRQLPGARESYYSPQPAWQDRCVRIRDEEGLISCSHLSPLEAALRAAGIARYHPPPGGSSHMVMADCWFDEEDVRRQYLLPGFVTYSPCGDHDGDGEQSFDCPVCRSSIMVFDSIRIRPRFPIGALEK